MNAVVRPRPSKDWRQQFGLNKPKMDDKEAIAMAQWILSYQKRPFDWVLKCYCWGVEGSPLEGKLPEIWQRRALLELQQELQRTDLAEEEVFNRVIRMAVAAGNGVGKTTFVAWLIHWFESVYPRGEAVITASTAAQLETKTWRELRKWQDLAFNGWQFEWTATRYKHKDMPEQWYASAIPWSESNPQAFAGTHEKYVLVIFDEASGIHAAIWDVIEGAMTTGLVFFFAFGNPSDTDGGFYDCFNKFAHMWRLRYRVDAREVSFANKKEIQGWIDTHGLDSDFVRVHVLGMFPKSLTTTFISSEQVMGAMGRQIAWNHIPRSVPRLMGVDLARQGQDLNAIVRRVGRKVDGKIVTWSERDTMVSADYIARAINEWQPDFVYVDGVGLGGPVVDYLKRRGFARQIVEVSAGKTPDNPDDHKRYANMRTCMWARMREWFAAADLPMDPELLEELTGPKFRFELRTDRMLLEPKAEMWKRGIKSPNKADALSFTFWHSVPASMSVNAGYAEPEAV